MSNTPRRARHTEARGRDSMNDMPPMPSIDSTPARLRGIVEFSKSRSFLTRRFGEKNETMSKIKGMVQFGDLTYRIVKVRSGAYDAIRILDEVRIGTFQTTPRLSLQAA